MNKTNYLKFSKILVWVAFAMSILFFLISVEDKSIESYLLTFIISLAYSFGFGLGNYFLTNYLNEKYSWVTETRRRIIAAVVGSLIMNIAITYLLNYINFVVVQGMSSRDFFSDKMSFTNWFFINLALLVSAVLHARGFMHAMKANAQAQVVEQKFIASSANAQFESIKNQLDPHFLFNSLNVLTSLIDENPHQAQNFTAALSKIYRYILEQKDKELVPLREEIQFARSYIGLLKYRFEDSIAFDIQLTNDEMEGFVIPLSLQLLLENCTKHNLATMAEPLRVKIYKKEGNLVIENNLQPRNDLNVSSGIGLSNIVQRYQLLTNRKVVIDSSDSKFKVEIPILTQKVKIMENIESQQRMAYEKAAERVKEIKGFYGNLISYCCVIPFLAGINLFTSPEYLWFFWPAAGWGLGVAIHGLNTFGIGKNWEERKVREIMEKEPHSSQWK